MTYTGSMIDRSVRREVTVPDVVGLPFHVGRDVVAEAGVTLANPDPDGPPMGGLAFPGLFYIMWQEPAPGTLLHEWDSVGVVGRPGADAQGACAQPDPEPLAGPSG